MKKILIILFSFSTMFLSCKSDSNCVSDIRFERENINPGPDLITFTIICNQSDFEKNIESYGLVEVIFNKKKTFKSDFFEIIKLKNNLYELKVRSPYFSFKNYHSEKQIYNLYKESSKMQINITLNNNKFVFTKCN